MAKGEPVMTHKLGLIKCPIKDCGRTLDAASGGSLSPMPGDVTVCAYCQNWLIFTEDRQLREITEEEIADLDQEAFDLLTKFSRLAAGVSMRRAR